MEFAIIKLSENIYFFGGFIKRVTVKQRLREVVISGTLIPSFNILN